LMVITSNKLDECRNLLSLQNKKNKYGFTKYHKNINPE